MDTVEGKKGGKVLLTLMFRKFNFMIAILLPDKTTSSVINAFNELETNLGYDTFKRLFNYILTDNGSEFLDWQAIEKWLECEMFYAHPYSCWERGTNENGNGIIRRWFPKGTDFGRIPLGELKRVEHWMNNYPRKILGGVSAKAYEKKLKIS